MAIAIPNGNRGSTVTLTGGANPTIDLPTGGAITVGNTLIMVASYDNSGTAGVDPNMWVVNSAVAATQLYGIDLRGNLWWRIAKVVRNSAGAANDGAVADIWAALVANAYTNGDDLTLQFSFPVAALAVQVLECSGVNTRSYSVVTPITGVGNGTTIGPTGTITPTVVGQLVIGVAAIESNTAITGDGDTTGGAWNTAVNQVANSGVDATSMRLFVETKIVTTTAAQDWDVTKTGAADWAALAVVFEAFTTVANGFVPGNPNYPCIAGAEVLPLDYDRLPVDTGTEYLQTHQVFPNSYGTERYAASHFVQFDPLGSGASYAHHAVMHEVYLSGAENVVEEVIPQTLLVGAAGVGAGASVSSGTAADAIASIGGAYVTLPNAGYVDVLFSPAILTSVYPNYRVVRWGVRYLAWKDDSAAPGPGEGILPEWRDSAANNGAGSAAIVSGWLVPNYKRDAQFETRWVGEVNPIIRGKGEILAQNSPFNAAFTVNDLSHMDFADQTTRLRLYGAQGNDPSQATVYLDYIEAIVELVPERRLAQGSRLISNAPTFASSSFYTDHFGSVQLYSPLNTNFYWRVPAAANTYVLATREAQPASPGDYYANLYSTSGGTVGRTVGFNESIGPSWLLRAVAEPRATLENPAMTGQPVLRRGIINGGVLAATPEEFDNFIISVAGDDRIRIALDGSFYPAYDFGGSAGDLSEIYTAPTGTRTWNVLVDGATQFDRIKVLVQPDELTTATLTITVEKPALTVLATATLTPAQALAEPDIGNGWREVSLPLNVAVTPTAGQVVIRFVSTTTATAPWRVALANPIGSADQFSYNYGQGQTDVAAVLQCTLAVPSVTLGNSTQNMYRPDGRCISDTITLPTITLTNGALYDWVSIERSTDAGVTYTPVVLLADTTNGQVYTDSAVPWDQTALSITYQVIGYRNADRLSVTTITTGWNAVATAPGIAFGLAAPNGALYAYLPTSEGAMDVTWNPLNPVSIVPLLGVDYQIPLRAPEERGLSVSFLVIVDQMLACSGNDAIPWDENIPTEGALSPAPFDQIRLLAKTERFQLLLPGGHNRFVTLTLSGLNIKTEKSIFLAEVTLTDVTTPAVSPYADSNA